MATVNAVADSLWDLVREEFDEKLPRRTAILIKEEDFGLPFAYPAEFGSIGWLLDNRDKTTYDEAPVVSLRFGEYSFPDLTRTALARNTHYFGRMQYFPAMARREVVFSNIGLEGTERFGQSPAGGFVWDIDLRCTHHPCYPFAKKLFTILTVHGAAARVRSTSGRGLVEVELGEGRRLWLASGHARGAVFATLDDAIAGMRRGTLRRARRTGRYVVLQYDVALAASEHARIRCGLSFRSGAKALQALANDDFETGLKAKWDRWFATLPPLPGASPRERQAYYKCWAVVRQNYYRHPRWGKSVLEAFPVYRGYWQWGLPAAEWHANLNPEIGPRFTRTVLDLFLRYQREDGYVTHAIYLDEEVPGERWAKGSIVQTPHIPWVALRYFARTGDRRRLEAWYPRLVKYHQYLTASRDTAFMNLHLWAILASYDTGLDTTAAFQKVTYGENGVREAFCYPAIFAAERCRYEQAMEKMSEILGNGEAAHWRAEWQATRRAMEQHLWDPARRWYGVIHEDGTQDTRVGVDGLFPLAYGVAAAARAQSAKRNFRRLLGRYGVYTVAPGEPGFCEEIYWRGPAWTKSCSVGMAAAFNYYPDLLPRVRDGLVRFLLKYPSVWECMSAATGKIARGDMGLMATPVVSSNVGAGEALGALRLARGINVFSITGEDYAARPAH